jgi:TetR/AcrR family fatty acid metabolism transcriptional regulator
MPRVAARPSQQEKREQILRGAVRAFAAKGYHECRVGDVAAEAGVAYGLVYRYFASKEELLETIFRDTWGAMLDRVRAIEISGDPAQDQLRYVAAIVLRSWSGDPDLIRVLVREVARSPHIQQEIGEIEQAFAALERIVARGQAAGEFEADVDARLAATIFYGGLEELLTGWVLGSLPSDAEAVAAAERSVVALFCNGLCRRD